MLPRHAIRIFAAAGALVFGVSGVAKAECQTFPKVPWWSNLSHQSVVRYVNDRHGGDWATYTDKWERQLASLEDVAARGKAVVIGKDRTRLSDEALKDYIGKIEKRLQITRCLSRQQEARTEKEAAALDSFETAAGSDNRDGVTQVADAVPGHVSVEVRAQCRGGAARFQVVNTGASWPKPGIISIHEMGSATPLSQRRMRLASGQSASFKVANPKAGSASLGLRVDPSWYTREFRYDATLSCPGNPSKG